MSAAPYYHDEASGITIYCGDCREIMPGLHADAIVSDPPYGISLDTRGGRPGQRAYEKIVGDDVDFDPTPVLALRLPTILWGANHYSNKLPISRGWIVWNKVTRNEINQKQAEVELAWTNCLSRPRAFRHMWMGGYRDSERGEAYHPAQKPTILLRWCLSFVVGTVLDPFMGSGTTLVAAKQLGRRAIGIEIEERYCEIAAKRLAQECMRFEPEPEPKPEQATMFDGAA